MTKAFLTISVISFAVIQSLFFTTYESLSIALFIYFLLAFLDNLGKKMVILDVVILNAIFICLLMPISGYHYFNSTNRLSWVWNIYMKVPSEQYFSFMFPALLALIIGLKLPIFFRKKIYHNHERYIINAKSYLSDMKWQGLILVAIGLFTSIFQQYVPGVTSHIFHLLSYLMFVGVFYCLYSNFPNKRIILVGVFGLMIVRSVSSGMFGELVFMSVMALILVMLGNKASFFKKLSLFAIGVFSILVLQSVKPEFRKLTWLGNSQENKGEVFLDLVGKKLLNPTSMFSSESGLFAFYARFNEGQVISRVIQSVPARYPYANGETIYKSLAATVVPRFLWPDKPESGGAYNFQRFLGVKLRGYSIGISPFGEAWGNFGKVGGIAFMLFFGLLLNFFFNALLKIAVHTKSLILWCPYLFFYSVQMETDIVTMLNSFTKAAMFTFVFYKLYPLVFKMKI